MRTLKEHLIFTKNLVFRIHRKVETLVLSAKVKKTSVVSHASTLQKLNSLNNQVSTVARNSMKCNVVCNTGCCGYIHDVNMTLCVPSIKCTLK